MNVLVMTRSLQAAQEQVEEEQRGKRLRSGVRPSPVDELAVETIDSLGEDPDDDGMAEGDAIIG